MRKSASAQAAESSGLALVLERSDSLDGASARCCDAAHVAAGVIAAEASAIATPNGDIDFQAVAQHVDAEIKSAEEAGAGEEDGPPWHPDGRLGPDVCAMEEVRGACSISGSTLLSR